MRAGKHPSVGQEVGIFGCGEDQTRIGHRSLTRQASKLTTVRLNELSRTPHPSISLCGLRYRQTCRSSCSVCEAVDACIIYT